MSASWACAAYGLATGYDGSWPIPAVPVMKSTRGCPTATCDPKVSFTMAPTECLDSAHKRTFLTAALLREKPNREQATAWREGVSLVLTAKRSNLLMTAKLNGQKPVEIE